MMKQDTSTQQFPMVSFLREVMHRRKRLPSQLAADLGVSHATVSRWLSCNDIPSTQSCQRLAEYSGWPLEKVLSFAGHLPEINGEGPPEWPEFGEYARRKYPNELNEDAVAMIEHLIDRRRDRKGAVEEMNCVEHPPKGSCIDGRTSLPNKELADFLREQCRQRRLSLRRLSIDSGLSPATVHNIINRHYQPTLLSLNRLADYLGVKRQYLWQLAGLLEDMDYDEQTTFADPELRFHFAQVDKLPEVDRNLIISIIKAIEQAKPGRWANTIQQKIKREETVKLVK